MVLQNMFQLDEEIDGNYFIVELEDFYAYTRVEYSVFRKEMLGKMDYYAMNPNCEDSYVLYTCDDLRIEIGPETFYVWTNSGDCKTTKEVVWDRFEKFIDFMRPKIEESEDSC